MCLSRNDVSPSEEHGRRDTHGQWDESRSEREDVPPMGSRRIPMGGIGKVHLGAGPDGRITASARYRDWTDAVRKVTASGTDAAAAERALRSKLASQGWFQPGFSMLSAESTFHELAEYWLRDLRSEARLATGTLQAYENAMRTLVLPALSPVPLRDVGVARCDFLLKQLAKRSYSRARRARVVLRLALGLAVRHEIIPRNPVDHVSRLGQPPRLPNALTPAQVNAVRGAIRHWESGLNRLGPKPDGQLGQLVEVMLGTSARIGEVLALRRGDIDVTGAPPTVTIAGTIVSHRGQTLSRQDHPKTSRSLRVVTIPTFAAEALRRRLAVAARHGPDALAFSTRKGTPLASHNVRRQLRQAMEASGIEGVTPHSFRRTVATAINGEANIDLAAELLGHSDSTITIRHYIRRDERVNPITAELLDRALGKGNEE